MKVLALILTILLSNNVLAQQKPNVAKIKELITKLYFGIPTYEQKFDVNVILRGSENFYRYREHNIGGIESISCGFEENTTLKYLGNKNEIMIFFDKERKIENILICSEYQLNDVQKAEMQYLDLIDLFYEKSYEAYIGDIINGDKEVIGRSVALYASPIAVKDNKPYLYVGFKETPRNSYEFSTRYYPNRIK